MMIVPWKNVWQQLRWADAEDQKLSAPERRYCAKHDALLVDTFFSLFAFYEGGAVYIKGAPGYDRHYDSNLQNYFRAKHPGWTVSDVGTIQ